MSKYGEPWHWGEGWGNRPLGDPLPDTKYADCQLYDANNNTVIPIRYDHYEPIWDISNDEQPTQEQRERIVICVNALAGISDPAAFVKAAKELAEAVKAHLSITYDSDTSQIEAAIVAMEGTME